MKSIRRRKLELQLALIRLALAKLNASKPLPVAAEMHLALVAGMRKTSFFKYDG